MSEVKEIAKRCGEMIMNETLAAIRYHTGINVSEEAKRQVSERYAQIIQSELEPLEQEIARLRSALEE